MKCAIYTRVSTDEQGTSIVNQQEYFKDYIQRNNFEIFDIYSDEAFSGTETSKRLSFQRLLEDGKHKRYEVLLAKSYSRFGRNQRETLTALAMLFEHGIRIIFVEDGLDSLRDKGQFGLFAWLAEQESRKLSDRVKMTWQVYNKEGKVHSPNAPLGYDYDGAIKNFVVNEKEAETVKLLFSLYLQGNGSNKIALYMNNSDYQPKRKGTWKGQNVMRILRNTFYLGYLTQGKMRTIDITIKKMEYLDKKDWFVHKGNHEAIISEEIFYQTQQEIKKRTDYAKQFEPIRHSTVALFSNLIKCQICGSNCMVRSRAGRVDVYVCRLYETHGTLGCGHKRNAIPEHKLIILVKSTLETLAKNDFKEIRDFYKQESKSKRREEAEHNVATLDLLIGEQTRLGNSLLGLFTEGIIGREQFKLQNDSISEKMRVLMEQREEALLEQNRLAIDFDEEGENINSIREILDAETTAWTNQMMKRAVNRIYLDMLKNSVEMAFNYQVAL
jgi:DNA invertase Pin-like site-specific DNA recombinase/plasmid stabilization system protein ParE